MVPALVEVRHRVEARQHEAVPAVERRVGALAPKVLEVLDAARAEDGAEHFSRRVVNQMAPGVGRRHLVALREAVRQRRRCGVIGRVAVRQERHEAV